MLLNLLLGFARKEREREIWEQTGNVLAALALALCGWKGVIGALSLCLSLSPPLQRCVLYIL